MGQSSFKWMVIYADGTMVVVISTQEDLPNVVDFAYGNIVSIVQVSFADGGIR